MASLLDLYVHLIVTITWFSPIVTKQFIIRLVSILHTYTYIYDTCGSLSQCLLNTSLETCE